MKIKRPLAAAVGLGLLVPLAACYPGEPDAVKTQAATQWLIGRQQADGGFELANFPGFETPDAVLALAEQAQTAPFFDTTEARQRIESIATAGGKTPLDNIDDLVDSATVPSVAASAQAAKLAVLVAGPLDIDLTDFDPSDDSAGPVNLIARINQYAQPNGSLAYGAQFNGVLYAAIALAKTDEGAPDGLLTQIENAQRADGSWNYAGNLDAATAGDVDTTSLALLALSTNGYPVDDDAVGAGTVFLASKQNPNGSFADDPNATALAAVALSDLHIDVTNAFWRAIYGNPVAGNTAYVSPYTWLNDQQANDGHIAGPNDQYGLNTFGTSQAVQALSRQWYLDDEYDTLTYSLVYDLMADSDLGPSLEDGGLVADALGPNPSIAAARVRSAAAAVNSPAGRGVTVDALFQQALDRPVDPSGRATFSAVLVDHDRPFVLQQLVTSAEFTSANGPSNSAYVDGLYRAILGRTPDAGKKSWVDALNKGASRASVARSFIASTEYRMNSVNDVYNLLVGRDATSTDQYFGLSTLASGRIETVIAQVGGSQEYYEQYFASTMARKGSTAEKGHGSFKP